MPTDKPLSRETRICLAIWRKAYNERDTDDPIVINCANPNMAIAMRQAMYRAIRPFREGKMFDEDLRLAAELFVVAIEAGDNINRLVMKPRQTLNMLESELAELGLTEQDLLLAEERLMGKSLNEFLEPSNESPARTKTPFYTRDE